jgi:DNA-binding CsgD family transcriptional regulator
VTRVKWSDGEAACGQALNDYAKTLAESDPQSAAELLGGAAGGADAARAAANIALLADVADQLASLTSDPDVFARAADLSSQCIGRVFIALDAINSELVEIAPSSFRLISEHGGFLDAEPPTKPVLTDYQAAVLWCVASGYDPKGIAERRKPAISPEAVRATLRECQKRLGARTTEHAVAIALRGGELQHHRPGVSHSMNRMRTVASSYARRWVVAARRSPCASAAMRGTRS